MAVAAYGRAMDHVGTMAVDPHFRWLDRVILDLHFDACGFQRESSSGLWRSGPIFVTDPPGGDPAYEGPPAGQVPELMAEVVEWLEHQDLDAHVAVRAAMAHLHVVSVHPFRDGNGRISRRYQPERDAMPWLRFCIAAHIDQAHRRLSQVSAAGVRWALLERMVEGRGWPDRLVVALEQSLFDGVERGAYATEAGISLATASSDLRRLLDAGLLVQRGRARSTRYVASDELGTQVAAEVSARQGR